MDPFNPATTGVPDFLTPQPPPAMPEPTQAGDATAALSPFKEALDVDAIIKNLVLDRPLKLFIPDKHLYPDYEFRIINSIPQEIANAANKGFKPVTDERLSALFSDLVAGTDQQGKAYRPILVARPRVVGEHIRKENRRRLQSLYAGMDPKQNDKLDGQYSENELSVSKGSFTGRAFTIRV